MLEPHTTIQESPYSADPAKWYDRTALVIASLLFLWPVGVYALIRNRPLSGFGKFVLGSGITLLWVLALGGAGAGGYYFYAHPDVAQRYLRQIGVKSAPSAAASAPKTLLDLPSENVANGNPAQSQVESSTSAAASTGTTVQAPIPAASVGQSSAPEVPTAKAQDVLSPVLAPAATVDIAPNSTPVKPKVEGLKVAQEPLVPQPADGAGAEAEVVRLDAGAFAPRPPKDADGDAAAAKSKELDAQAATLQERAAGLAASKKNQVTKFETAIADYAAATNLEPLYQDIEAAFRKDLIDTYKSDHFETAQFNLYFTPEYIANYNAQLKRRQGAMAQYNKILLDGDASLRAASTKLMHDIDETNARLAEAGKPKLQLPPNYAALDSKLDELRAKISQLPQRLVTLEDLRARIGSKAESSAQASAQPPIQNAPPNARVAQPGQPADTVDLPRYNPPPPSGQPSPRYVQPPIISQSGPTQPPQVSPPSAPPPLAPPAMSAFDAEGVWVRGDGKVTWVLEQNGSMLARGKDKKATRGVWGFDDRTATVTVTHDGAVTKLSLVKERDLWMMLGGVGASTLRFTKATR